LWRKPEIDDVRHLMAVAALLLGSVDAAAQIQMPDPSVIAGKALPASDLPTGTVTVRLVREALGNDVADHEIRVRVAGTTTTAKTDAEGRAEFARLRVGGDGRAETTLDRERLVSDSFSVPSTGGLRVILVGGLARAAERRKQEEAAAAAAPPVRGAVVFGGETRIVMEFQDDTLRVFYILDILNNARTRVDIGGPLIIDLPRGSAGASTLEGSSPSATVQGNRLTVTGPFAPGSTNVTVGFQLRYDAAELVFTQTWPAALEQVTVAAEKIGGLAMTSPQFSSTGDIRADNGTSFVLANGPRIPAGGTLTVQLANLPIHSRWPRYTALGLVIALIAAGAWLAVTPATSGKDDRRRLMQRKDALLAELVRLEERRRAGAGDATRDATRRQRLVSELERVLGDLDEPFDGAQGRPDGGPRGGGEGIAA
jgi:hypothetical protein